VVCGAFDDEETHSLRARGGDELWHTPLGNGGDEAQSSPGERDRFGHGISIDQGAERGGGGERMNPRWFGSVFGRRSGSSVRAEASHLRAC
jgi:hypothetical protein